MMSRPISPLHITHARIGQIKAYDHPDFIYYELINAMPDSFLLHSLSATVLLVINKGRYLHIKMEQSVKLKSNHMQLIYLPVTSKLSLDAKQLNCVLLLLSAALLDPAPFGLMLSSLRSTSFQVSRLGSVPITAHQNLLVGKLSTLIVEKQTKEAEKVVKDLLQAYAVIQLKSPKPYPNYEQHLRHADNFMRENFQQPITATEIAHSSRLPIRTFEKVFKAHYSLTPIQYLEQVRLRHAEMSLRSSHDSIKDVAYDAGFKDQDYFSRVFKRIHRTTPSLYRQWQQGSGTYL